MRVSALSCPMPARNRDGDQPCRSGEEANKGPRREHRPDFPRRQPQVWKATLKYAGQLFKDREVPGELSSLLMKSHTVPEEDR